MDDAQRKAWRDFKFTVDVVLSAALAREDLTEVQASGVTSTASLRFNLLAAAAAEEPALPTDEWRDTRQLVSASLIQSAGELRVTFQALGFAALSRIAGRAARMVSSNGEIEIGFRFDSGGRGITVLDDSPSVRRALADFSIVLD
jgi:hypothetical protein